VTARALTTTLACSFPVADAGCMESDGSPDRTAVLAFKHEVRRWARQIEVSPRSVTVRQMRTKWGSCSVDGRLTFDLGLVRLPSEQRNEVIVHELLHLRVPNHGPLFRSMLRAYLNCGQTTPV
jgi:predicted metal-dependent hydrolase